MPLTSARCLRVEATQEAWGRSGKKKFLKKLRKKKARSQVKANKTQTTESSKGCGGSPGAASRCSTRDDRWAAGLTTTLQRDTPPAQLGSPRYRPAALPGLVEEASRAPAGGCWASPCSSRRTHAARDLYAARFERGTYSSAPAAPNASAARAAPKFRPRAELPTNPQRGYIRDSRRSPGTYAPDRGREPGRAGAARSARRDVRIAAVDVGGNGNSATRCRLVFEGHRASLKVEKIRRGVPDRSIGSPQTLKLLPPRGAAEGQAKVAVTTSSAGRGPPDSRRARHVVIGPEEVVEQVEMVAAGSTKDRRPKPRIDRRGCPAAAGRRETPQAPEDGAMAPAERALIAEGGMARR